MTDVRKVPLPRTPAGQVSWEALAPYLELTFREILARFDPRNPQNDFASAFVVDSAGAATIGVDAKVADQRTLPIVNAGNRLSAQSANPLTSVGSPTTASITVAAHTVRYGFGTVSYNGGTISGLTPAVSYFVYADDPDYEGGAVAYTATTSQQTVVASNGRYYVGAITTAISSTSGNITAATSASPIAITSAGHGLSNGQQVTFSGMPGDFAALNGNTYVVTVTGLDTFTVAVNGAAFAAYTTGGSWTRVSTPTGGRPGGGWGDWTEVP
jgi:hypothetical protein